MSDFGENSEVYNHYLKLSTPTEEDLKRVFSDAELKELCLRRKCTVDLWKYNVVVDYRDVFLETGRFQKWSPSERLRMLAKAVNKRKPLVLYGEDEIKKARKEEWEFRLKDNILSLNYWQRKKLPCPDSESDEIDCEVQSQFINTESTNDYQLSGPLEVNNFEDVLLIEQLPEEGLIEELSEDSVETVVHIDDSYQYQIEDKILDSEEVAPAVVNIYGVNSMSMTIDSEMSTQSQESPLQQSQDVIPPNYDHFKNIIPLTSTQSQNGYLGEKIVS